MRIMSTVKGTVETLRGFEEKSYHFVRSKKLTLKGAERLVKMKNPITTFKAYGIDYMVFDR